MRALGDHVQVWYWPPSHIKNNPVKIHIISSQNAHRTPTCHTIPLDQSSTILASTWVSSYKYCLTYIQLTSQCLFFQATPCYFCPETAPLIKYDRPKIAKHLIERHGFTAGSFLISDIEVSRAKYRIIFPESPVCPIPGCRAGKLLFTNESFGAHLRKKGNVTEPTFMARIAEGYYFSWRINIKTNDPCL